MQSKAIKNILGSVSILITYAIIFIIEFPIRVRTDEYPISYDIQTIIATGHFRIDQGYPWGKAYQASTGIILKVIALPYSATQWLSPLIGAVIAAFIITTCWLLVREVGKTNPNIILVNFLTVIVFGTWYARLRETGHKGYTFTLFFCILLVLAWYIERRNKKRYAVIFFIGFTTMTVIQSLWAIIYGVAVGSSIIIYKLNKSFPPLLLVSGVCGGLVLIFSPWTPLLRDILILRFINPVSTGESVSRGGSVSLIEAWGKISIAGIEFSIWYATIIGVVGAGLLAIIGGLIALRDRYNWKYRSTASLILGPSVVIGIWFIYLIATGDLVTAKRLVALPAIVLIAYLAARIAGTHSLTLKQQQVILGVIMIILVISAFSTLPRSTLDGNINPNDAYISEKEFNAVQWSINTGGDISPRSNIYRIASRKVGQSGVEIRKIGKSSNVVYDNGGEAHGHPNK